MIFLTLISYLPYALITAFTPGPNNILALFAVSQNGWRKGKLTLLGMIAGFFGVMLACAAFCYELATLVPAFTSVLKYVGAVYIAWLAIKIARSKPEDADARQISFWQGFALQFANIKVILYGITVYVGYVLPRTGQVLDLLGHAAFLTAVGVAGMLTWAVAGGGLQKFLTKYYQPFNLLMAAILLFSAVELVVR